MQNEEVKKRRFPVAAVIMLIAAVLITAAGVFVIIKSRMVTDTYDGPNWYDEDVEEPDLPEVESFTDIGNGEDSLASEWVYGSGIDNDGITADEEAYYFADPSANHMIYRIEKDDPHTRTMISDLAGADLNVIDGRVYFFTSDFTTDSVPGIYSVGTDGENPEFLMEGEVSNLDVINDWVYYIRDCDKAICKFQTDDRREIVVCDKECSFFMIRENTIYFMADIPVDDETGDKEKTFCTVDVNGRYFTEVITQDQIQEIVDNADYDELELTGWYDLLSWDPGFDLNSFTMDEDNVYLISWDEGYITVPVSKLSPGLSQDIVINGFRYVYAMYSEPIFYGDYVVYRDAYDVGTLRALKNDGTVVDVLEGDCITDIFNIDDLVIIQWADDNGNNTISANNLGSGESVDLFSN